MSAAVLPFRRLRPSEVQRYVNSVPLVDLKFAAGTFTATRAIDPDEVDWVELPDLFRPKPGLFVTQVVGESMAQRLSPLATNRCRALPSETAQIPVSIVQPFPLSPEPLAFG